MHQPRTYLLIDENDYPEEDLATMRNLVAAVSPGLLKCVNHLRHLPEGLPEQGHAQREGSWKPIVSMRSVARATRLTS